MDLLELYNNISLTTRTETMDGLLSEVACQWLNHNTSIMDNKDIRRPWFQNFPVTDRNKLFIGKC